MTRSGQLETQLSMDAALERAEDWAANATALIAVLRPGVRLTADNLRRVAGDPPAENAMGGVFRRAARAGLLRCVGYTTSTRPDAHGRLLREWERT